MSNATPAVKSPSKGSLFSLLSATLFNRNKKLINFTLIVFFVCSSNFAVAQSAGFNSSYAVFNNGTSDTYYCMFSNTSCGPNPALGGATLGSYTFGASNLTLKGAQFNVYKCGGADITSTRLNYRIYLSSSPSGSFIALNTGYSSGSNNGCGGQDQQWQDLSKNINVLSGLSVGSYTIEIYADESTSLGTQYLSNSGNNYKATFTVTAATPTVTVTGNTTPYTFTGSPLGPNTASNTGTGSSYTFSYVGVSGTTYGPSATQPTNVGSYTVTATVAANGNYAQASSSATAFSITAATPTVTVTGNTTPYTFTGSPLGPNTASNTGTGSSYTFSYVGVSGTTYGPSATQPTNVGSYTVTATVAANGNYAQASSSATAFSIVAATPTVTVTGNTTPYTYSGSPQGPNTASNSGTGSSYTFSYVGVSGTTYGPSATQPTNVGSYTVTATVAANGNYAQASSSATAFSIVAATPTVTVTGNTTPYTYSGSPQGPNTASNTGTGSSYTFSYVGVSGTTYGPSATQPTNVGSYTVTATVAANGNYAQASSSATAFSITKASSSISVTGSNSFAYDGNPQGPTTYTESGSTGAVTFSYVGVSGTTYSASATRPTNPGTYEATATVAADANYNGASSSAFAFSITGLGESTASFRSNGNVNFTSATNWQYDLGGGTWTGASGAPTSSNNITILNGDIATVNTNFTAGAGKTLLISSGSLIVNPGVTLDVASTGTLNFNGQSVTVKSDATGSGSIGQILGTLSGATNVTVERYIPQNAYRAWRLLSVPTKSSGQTFHQAWQENQGALVNGIPGKGTLISTATAANFVANGFDAVTQGGSLRSYNGSAFVDVANTNTALETKTGYFLYVRGDRSIAVNGSYTAAGATTLRTTGTLYQGNSSITGLGSGLYALVGNVYASEIDFSGISRTGIDNKFYVWDASLGGTYGGAYRTFLSGSQTGGTYVMSGGSATAEFPLVTTHPKIASGQAFLVHTNAAGAAITLSEGNKSTGHANQGFRPASADKLVMLTTNLYAAGQKNASDGNVVLFDKAYGNAVDANDADKLTNPGENFGITRDGKTLAIETRQDITAEDVIYFNMKNMKQQDYSLEFTATNMQAGMQAFLEDSYLGTSTAVDLTAGTRLNFAVTADAKSSAANRFKLVFRPSIPVTVNGKSFIKVSPNPVEGTNMNIQFSNQPAGRYNIQLTDVVGRLVFSSYAQHAGGTATQALTLPSLIGRGTYQMEIIAPDKTKSVQKIIINQK